jgi:hypothetical protein
MERLERKQKKNAVAKQQQFEFEQTRTREQEEWDRVQLHLAKLPETDREALIDAALANADGMLRTFAQKYRQKPEEGAGEIMYQIALKNHILPLLALEMV